MLPEEGTLSKIDPKNIIYIYISIAILDVFVPNNKAAIYMNWTLMELKIETEKSTTRAGNFNILLSINEQLENHQGYRTQQYHQPMGYG